MSETSAAAGFIRLYNLIITYHLPRIGANALAVYLVLKLHENQKTRQCYPSTRTISRLSKLSRPTVLKAICTLEEEGLIRVERKRTKRGKPVVNLYTLLPVGQPALPSMVNDDDVGQSPLPATVKQIDHLGKGALPEQDLINKTQENIRSAAQQRRAPTGRTPAPQCSRDPNLDHPAVVAYRKVCKLTPNETQRAAIAAAVTDIPKWQEVIRRWLLKDYRKSNVEGMLDWYKDGIPARSGGNGRHETGGRSGFQRNSAYEQRESRPRETPEETARRDAEWEALGQSQNGTQLDGR